MELNEEVVKKSLDWLDSLVGSSNDSDIALLTYQLLGILYDTCEELSEKNAIQVITAIELDKQVQRLTAELTKKETEYNELYELTEDLRNENERLKKPRHILMPDGIGGVKIETIPSADQIRADTVRKMQERLIEVFSGDGSLADCICSLINTISKEMLEGNNEEG